MNWKEAISDPPSQAHKEAVLRSVAADLNSNRSRGRSWIWLLAGVLPAAAALFLAFRWNRQNSPIEGLDEDLDWLASHEMEELDLLLDLELLEDLEVLELWEG